MADEDSKGSDDAPTTQRVTSPSSIHMNEHKEVVDSHEAALDHVTRITGLMKRAFVPSPSSQLKLQRSDAFHHFAHKVSDKLKHENRHREKEHASEFRTQLGETLESHRTNVFIITLLVVDVMVVIVELIMKEDSFPQGRATHVIEELLHVTSLAILSVFALELLAMLVAFGFAVFHHRGYIVDLIVVPTSMALELTLGDEAGLLVLLRLWRLVRIAHAVFESTHKHEKDRKLHLQERVRKEAHAEVDLLERKIQRHLSFVHRARDKLESQRSKIERLEVELDELRKEKAA